MEDTYHTVGFKLISAFNWLLQASLISESSRLKWILKLDDDVLLNIVELQKFVEGIELSSKFLGGFQHTYNTTDDIYCHVKPDDPPLWDKTLSWNKW